MAKHRELAQDSASRIWRTVVVAGAMLGAPLTAVAGDPPPPPAKADKAPAAPAQINPGPRPPSYVAPPTKAELAKIANDRVKSIALDLTELDKKIATSTKDIKNAKDQSARDTANTTLKDQQTQKTELKALQVTAKADAKKADAAAKAEANANKPQPRPRADKNRPVGRGFILS